MLVTRGENRGRTLSYHHPVRDLTPVGMWEGEAMTLRLPLKDLKAMGGDCLVACSRWRMPGRSSAPPSTSCLTAALVQAPEALSPKNKTGRLTDPFDTLPLE